MTARVERKSSNLSTRYSAGNVRAYCRDLWLRKLGRICGVVLSWLVALWSRLHSDRVVKTGNHEKVEKITESAILMVAQKLHRRAVVNGIPAVDQNASRRRRGKLRMPKWQVRPYWVNKYSKTVRVNPQDGRQWIMVLAPTAKDAKRKVTNSAH